MSVVTAVDLHGITISYFDGRDQLIPYRGYTVEGKVPYDPKYFDVGWVYFDLEVGPTINDFFAVTQDLARRLFCDLGFTAEQVMDLLEDF